MKINESELTGMTKRQIIEIWGDGFNFYPENIWSYILSKTWYGKKTVLFIKFENDVVSKTIIKKMYGKISTTGLYKDI